ncbi:PLP-dependent cysteine synthase family protein [Pectinatus frisingensis]|jgi:cysteine synthase|uniref:PLP-dependent cysteine synthase family protein n=1 Tax=Pectinatus frisingensis TaxID=865 RepID=UPI0015F47FD8|nr:cysteine synthase family protein [Pectinatus frisingensis]
MKYYNGIHSLIGKTPLLKLNNIGLSSNINVFAKLEFYNPGGSVKDRIGVFMLDAMEKRGEIKPGATIVEATAGNTGIGIALAALNKGYKVIFVVPEKFSVEKQCLMRALGAEIINTPREGGMLGAKEKALEIKSRLSNAVSFDQFDNLDNTRTHYETTGVEIYDDLDGKIDYFVAGAGSGGTYTGAARYLKEKNHEIKGILADPVGSTLGGGEHSDYDIEGIGNDFVPATMDLKLVDKVIKISDQEALDGVRLLAKHEGIFVGTSSGAALSAVLKLTKQIDKGNIAVIFPDRGDRYFSKKIYG